MRKSKKDPPPIVQFAMLACDYAALSRLGRAGAMRKKEIREKDKKRKIASQLRECAELAHEANEDICPVND